MEQCGCFLNMRLVRVLRTDSLGYVNVFNFKINCSQVTSGIKTTLTFIGRLQLDRQDIYLKKKKIFLGVLEYLSLVSLEKSRKSVPAEL